MRFIGYKIALRGRAYVAVGIFQTREDPALLINRDRTLRYNHKIYFIIL